MKSNCLITALKMRLLKGYKVYYVKTDMKEGIPHFCWWNHETGEYQHYTWKTKSKTVNNEIWFDGKIDLFPIKHYKGRFIRVL